MYRDTRFSVFKNRLSTRSCPLCSPTHPCVESDPTEYELEMTLMYSLIVGVIGDVDESNRFDTFFAPCDSTG